MKKQLITGVAVLALGASLAIAATQQDNTWGGHHGKRGEMSQRFAQKLNLTDAQKQQLAAIHKSFREENATFLAQFRQTKKDFHAAKQAGDQAKIDALKPAVESNRAQMKSLRQAQEQKVLAILTPDQQAQYQALKAARAARHQSKESEK